MASCGPPERSLRDLYADRPALQALDTSPLLGRRILIDPGHGGFFAGSRGLSDTREADVNLGVGLYLWGLLRDAGADVHLTRASDRDLLPDGSDSVAEDLAQRVALLDSLQPEVFLSLHHNSNATLDRERNAVETYFKLDDEGPSYDLARAVHRALAATLGIEQASLRPGNYFVLRESSTASVLGEASYLSHPDVESRLQLAEKQLLEAEAYFLGLLDYFSRGIPQLHWMSSVGDTLGTRDLLRIGVRADAFSPLDPLSLRVRVDGRPVSASFDDSLQTVQVILEGLAPGEHEVAVHVRNLRGNAAPPLHKRFLVWLPPRHVRLVQDPPSVASGSDARLQLEVLGASDQRVADGLVLRVECRGCVLDTSEATTRHGGVRLRARRVGTAARLRVQVAGIDTTIALNVSETAPPTLVARVTDASSGAPLADTWVQNADAAARRTDDTGLVVLSDVGDSLVAWRRGYVPRRLATTDRIALAPLHRGILLDTRIVLDPFGSGLEPTSPQWGVSGQQLAFDLVSRLAASLEAAGARVFTTRGPAEDVAELERIRLAGRVDAQLYVRVEVDLEPRRPAVVLHYPQSRGGTRLAHGMASALLQRALVDSALVVTDTQPVLLQTPCPAVVVRIPVSTPAASGAVWDTRLRQHVYALQWGLRRALSDTSGATLTGRILVQSDAPQVPDLLLLDRAELVQPDAVGRFRFESLVPGEHELSVQRGHRIWRHWITVGADSTSIELTLP